MGLYDYRVSLGESRVSRLARYVSFAPGVVGVTKNYGPHKDLMDVRFSRSGVEWNLDAVATVKRGNTYWLATQKKDFEEHTRLDGWLCWESGVKWLAVQVVPLLDLGLLVPHRAASVQRLLPYTVDLGALLDIPRVQVGASPVEVVPDLDRLVVHETESIGRRSRRRGPLGPVQVRRAPAEKNELRAAVRSAVRSEVRRFLR